MKNNFQIIFCTFVLLIGIQIAHAKSDIYNIKNPDLMTESQIRAQRESLKFEDELLVDLNHTLGIQGDPFYTKRDKNRLSFGMHFSTNYNDFTEYSSFEATYMQNLRTYDSSWWGVLIKKGSGDFKALTENHDVSASAAIGDESHTDNQRPDSAAQSVLTYGIGYGHRFRFFLDFIKTPRFYEQITAFVTYNMHTDAFTENKYTGGGFVVDYELFKRSTQRIYYGFKLSYNFALVSKTTTDNVTRGRDGRFTLSWASAALTIGYFY
ncbi:MAG: hypothetical protein ACI9QD_001056 [Thermoproteota archaeon]|jgi:hypothetical protein